MSQAIEFLREIDWPAAVGNVAVTLLSLFLVLLLRQLLDAKLFPKVVKLLHWIPVRTIVRSRQPNLNGFWDHEYDIDNYAQADYLNRNENRKIYQFWNYIYCTFIADGEKYFIFGTISDNYINGVWQQKKMKFGAYTGSFQFKIVTQDKLEGRWIGFSASESVIRHGAWKWNRTDQHRVDGKQESRNSGPSM